MTVTPGSDVINIQKEVTSSIYKTVKYLVPLDVTGLCVILVILFLMLQL